MFRFGNSTVGWKVSETAFCFSDPPTANDVGTPKPSKNEADDDDDEPPLNEDDDDDDFDDLEQGDEEPSTNHLVLAQFEKVCLMSELL